MGAFKTLIRKHFHPDACNAIYCQLPRRRSGEIDNPTALVGSPVVDAHDNLLAIGKIRDPDLGPERQTGVGRGQGILVKGLTTGGLLAVVLGSVPGCHAILLLLASRTTAANQRKRQDQNDQDKSAPQGTSKRYLAAWRLRGWDPGLETAPVMGESRKRLGDSRWQEGEGRECWIQGGPKGH